MLRLIPFLWLVVACGEETSTPRVAPSQLLLEGQASRARPQTVQELREARDRPHDPLDGSGTARILEVPSPLVAGSRARIVLEYEAGPEGLPAGARVEFLPEPFWGWSPPQTRRPPASGYTTVSSPDGATFELRDLAVLSIELEGDGLGPGERLRVVYGDGSGTAFVDRYAEEGSRLWFRVDGNGDGFSAVVPDSPRVDLVAGPVQRMAVHLPSVLRPGDEAVVTIAFLDRLGNTGTPATGELFERWTDSRAEPARSRLEGATRLSRQVRRETPGLARYHVELRLADGSSIEAVSNPMLVEADGPRILWGDFHGHSQLTDGTGTVEAYLAYARDVAALDVVAITDHDHWGMRPLDEEAGLVQSIRDAVEAAHEPGRFVALFGFEWTSWLHGHRHVVGFDDELPWISSIDEQTDDPDELWSALGGKNALTFAHHSAGDPIPTNWEFRPPAELEPVTEVASVHGSSEAPDAPFVLRRPLAGNFVRDALDRGYALGFVGSGDSHDGHPGLTHLAAPNAGGLAAIVAADPTRKSVLESLRARRTYATNGPRIVVRTALGGRPMGSDVPAGTAPRPLYVRAIGTAPLAEIDIIRSGDVVLRQEVAPDALEFEGTFDIESLAVGEYVYLRIRQADGGCAWTSPFFVR